MATTRAKAVPSAIDEVTIQKWLYRLADPYDYSALGVRGSNIPAAVPGRCVDAGTLRQMHIATPGTDLAAAVESVAARWPGTAPKAAAIGRLPEELTVAELGMPAQLQGEPWRFPVGLREEDLAPGVLEVYEGEHVLISGPARSGKSTLLLALAESIRASSADGEPVAVWGACGRRSPLANAGLDKVAVGPEDLPALLASIRLERGPVVLLVDDAERFEDSDASLANLLASGQRVCVIAAGRSADLRALYAHWTKTLRKSRCGVLLQPDVDYDGELLGVTLPRRAPVAVTPGRGYLCVGGTPAFIQSMGPGTTPGA